MEIWRKAANPWGQEVLIGISWDLMWLAIAASVAFVVGHIVWIRTRGVDEADREPAAAPAGVPRRVLRHTLPARLFHWVMAAAMLVLLVTAFAPVMGFRFPWVTVHWIAGVVLTASVAFHVVHAIGWQDFWAMMRIDVAEGVATLRHILRKDAPPPPPDGKYPFDHRLYHHVIVVVGMGVIVTGLLMMVRIDTPFWARNPYLLSDAAWGVVYVVHGLCGVSLIFLTAAHIYFALRPEKLWITWSMIRGWIDREHYVRHFDPERWPPVPAPDEASSPEPTGALADAVPQERR